MWRLPMYDNPESHKAATSPKMLKQIGKIMLQECVWANTRLKAAIKAVRVAIVMAE